jgi:hypothetical protein
VTYNIQFKRNYIHFMIKNQFKIKNNKGLPKFNLNMPISLEIIDQRRLGNLKHY